jgi:hypothetical protein
MVLERGEGDCKKGPILVSAIIGCQTVEMKTLRLLVDAWNLEILWQKRDILVNMLLQFSQHNYAAQAMLLFPVGKAKHNLL